MARSINTWNALNTDYRKRLERSGITRERYLSGDKLTAGRGHAKTPERPERAYKHSEQYEEYLEKRKLGPTLPTVDDVFAHVKKLLLTELNSGHIERLDLSEVKDYIKESTIPVRLQMLNMTADDYRDKASYQQPKHGPRPAQPWFIKIGNDWHNPFWYH